MDRMDRKEARKYLEQLLEDIGLSDNVAVQQAAREAVYSLDGSETGKAIRLLEMCLLHTYGIGADVPNVIARQRIKDAAVDLAYGRILQRKISHGCTDATCSICDGEPHG